MRWTIATLYFFLRLCGRLPLSVLHALGVLLGSVLAITGNRARRITDSNLSLLVTQFEGKTRQPNAKESLREFGKSIFELCRIWSGNPRAALALVRGVRGGELFDQALIAGRGLIIAAPHLGCWELLNFWLCSRTPIAIVYRPPRQADLEPLLVRARGELAAEQIRAEGASGVRRLFKRLNEGGVIGILPDQQPKQGEGEFAPFFGIPALTMVLLSRLAQRTGAQVLFAFAERLPRGAGYCLHFLPAPDGIADPHLPIAVAALNRGIEECVRLTPNQYQWQYKRYSIQPPGTTRKIY